MKSHLVSICIPTYNGEKYLEKALNSVNNQIYQNIEVIISDDASNDNTLEICEKFRNRANFPVHIFHHKPCGIGANWNNCIEKSNGEFIKFLFQDDLLEPECVETMLSYLLKFEVDIVICKRKIIAEDFDSEFHKNWMKKYGDLQQGINLDFFDFYNFSKADLNLVGSKYELSYNFIGEPITSLFKKELFKDVGEFSYEMKQLLDLEYWLRILKSKSLGILNQELVSFRIHNQQTSSVNSRAKVDESEIIEKILFNKFFSFLNPKQRKILLYKKYPILKKMMMFLYKMKIKK